MQARKEFSQSTNSPYQVFILFSGIWLKKKMNSSKRIQTSPMEPAPSFHRLPLMGSPLPALPEDRPQLAWRAGSTKIDLV